MQGALKYFSDIGDPRSLRNQKHPLLTLIGTTLLASLSGIDSFSGFADFTEAHYEKLIEYFDFPYGCASHDTYQRLWDSISFPYKPTTTKETFNSNQASYLFEIAQSFD